MMLRALFLLCAILPNHAWSQTFMAVPDALLQKEIQFEQANECYIYFNNPSGDSLQLHWRLLDSNLPEEWDADLCDYGTCYIGIPSNGLMNFVYDTIQPYLKLIVQPGMAPGATWIWFRVYEEGNEDNFEDVFFSLHTTGTLDASIADDSRFGVFPNPASSYLTMQNGQTEPAMANLVSINGQRFWQGMLPPDAQVSVWVGDWPTGVYFLQAGASVRKILISK